MPGALRADSARVTERSRLPGPLTALVATLWLAHALWIHPAVDGVPRGHPLSGVITVANGPILFAHEAGHLIATPTGWRSLILVMGTVMQLAFPAALVFEAWRRRAPWLGVVFLNLLAISAYGAANYIADAHARALPLITGDPDTHDWGQLIYEIWHVGGLEGPLSALVRVGGVAAQLAAVAVAIRPLTTSVGASTPTPAPQSRRRAGAG